MKLLTESFQRQFVIRDFKTFISQYSRAFIPVIRLPPTIPTILTNNETYLNESNIESDILDLSNNVETELDTNVETELDANIATELDANDATELDTNNGTELDVNNITPDLE
jgi:hypothetical protein